MKKLWHRFLYWLDRVLGRPVKARGEALDRMGSWLSMARNPGESDRAFRIRMKQMLMGQART